MSKTVHQVIFVGDARQCRQAMQLLEGDTKKLEGGFGRLDGVLKTALGAASVAGALTIGKALFNVGVESEAMGARFRAVFGENTAVLDAWVEANVSKFGVAKDALQGYIAQVANMLTPLGLTTEEAGTQATKVLEMANAWSAWSGGEKTALEAADALTKGMMGQTRGLIDLGMKITEEEVAAYLASKGLDKLEGSARVAAEAQARFALMTERSGPAFEVFDETMKGGLGAQREMSAALDTVKDSLGDMVVALAPAITGVANLISAIDFAGGPIKEIEDFKGAWAKLNKALLTGEGLEEARQAFIDTGQSAERVDEWIAKVGPTFKMTGKAAGIAEAAFESVTGVLGGLTGATIEADDAIGEAESAFSTGFLTDFEGLVGDAATGVGELASSLSDRLVQAGKDSNEAIKAIEVADLADRMDDAVTRVGDAWGELPGLITEHHGNVQAAMADVLDTVEAENQFQRDLAALAAAGCTNLADTLRSSPDRANAMAAAKGFAADLAAAADVEAAMRSTTVAAILAANPNLYMDTVNRVVTAMRGFGQKLRAALLSGFGTVNVGSNAGGGGFVKLMAAGGPVSAGDPYVVGEKGPELFVPRSSGQIIPSSSGGPSVTSLSPLNVVLNVDGRELARTLVDPMADELERRRRGMH